MAKKERLAREAEAKKAGSPFAAVDFTTPSEDVPEQAPVLDAAGQEPQQLAPTQEPKQGASAQQPASVQQVDIESPEDTRQEFIESQVLDKPMSEMFDDNELLDTVEMHAGNALSRIDEALTPDIALGYSPGIDDKLDALVGEQPQDGAFSNISPLGRVLISLQAGLDPARFQAVTLPLMQQRAQEEERRYNRRRELLRYVLQSKKSAYADARAEAQLSLSAERAKISALGVMARAETAKRLDAGNRVTKAGQEIEQQNKAKREQREMDSLRARANGLADESDSMLQMFADSDGIVRPFMDLMSEGPRNAFSAAWSNLYPLHAKRLAIKSRAVRTASAKGVVGKDELDDLESSLDAFSKEWTDIVSKYTGKGLDEFISVTAKMREHKMKGMGEITGLLGMRSGLRLSLDLLRKWNEKGVDLGGPIQGTDIGRRFGQAIEAEYARDTEILNTTISDVVSYQIRLRAGANFTEIEERNYNGLLTTIRSTGTEKDARLSFLLGKMDGHILSKQREVNLAPSDVISLAEVIDSTMKDTSGNKTMSDLFSAVVENGSVPSVSAHDLQFWNRNVGGLTMDKSGRVQVRMVPPSSIPEESRFVGDGIVNGVPIQWWVRPGSNNPVAVDPNGAIVPPPR